MLKLAPEEEASYATFWASIDLAVSDSGPHHVQIADNRHDDAVVMFMPRTAYAFITAHFMETYADDEPKFIRESILQELS